MSSVASSSEYECPPPECDVDSVSNCEAETASRIASSASVSSIASFPEYDLETNVSISELKNKMSEIIKSKGQSLIQACRNFDRRSTNKITKSQLRQVIRIFCLPVSAAQFDCLCKEFQMNVEGKINYFDFFFYLSGVKIPKISKSLQKIPDNTSVDEAELMIKEKVKNNLRDIIRSFWLFDMNKDGFIQKAELRRIIRNYCFDLSDKLFNDLWKSYDPNISGLISYRDFLIKLGISADRYKKYLPSATTASWKENKKYENFDNSWEQKCKRAALENRDDPAIQGLPLEEIIIILIHRLRRRYKVLKDTFSAFDSEKNGKVSLSDFRGIINFFVLAMSASLFNRVMKKLNIDVAAEGLDYHTFLEDFCEPENHQIRSAENLDVVCAPVIQRIKNRVLNPEARLRSVFTKINRDQEWQITRPELKKALELGLDFKLTDDEFKELTTILDPGNTNVINCVDFIHLFEDSCKINDNKKEAHILLERDIDIEKYRTLRGQKLYSKLKHHLNKNIHNIEKAILVCDSDQSGFILPEKLKDILAVFCFPMSDEQFEEITSILRTFGNRINYHEFLTAFKKMPDEDTQKWIEVVDKLVHFKSRCPPEMPVSEVKEMLKDCIKSRKTAILQDFRTLDVCNVGVCCKDDVRNILAKFAFRLTDKQFETLWESFPRNKYDQLLYDAFLEKYLTPVVQSTDAEAESKNLIENDQRSTKGEAKQHKKVSLQEPESKFSNTVRRDIAVKLTENRKTTKEIFYSKAPHLKKLFESMEPTIIRNFRAIRCHLRREDPKVTNRVDFVTLKSILSKSGIYFNKEDEFHILEYFDGRFTGKINYREFLRIFVWYA